MHRFAKNVFVALVDTFAKILGWSFPPEYVPRQKLRMLLARYESETIQLFSASIRPGMTVLDIGAHIGYYTRTAAKRVGKGGRVIAFEADADNFRLLEENTKESPNVVRVNEAVSNEKGSVSFYHVEGSTGCHTLLRPDGQSSAREVRATSVDAYMEESGLSSVDVVKMDIEGGEWKALAGMTRILLQPHATFFIEYNPKALRRAGIEPVEILRTLFVSGFAINALTPNGAQEIPATHPEKIEQFLDRTGSVNMCAKK